MLWEKFYYFQLSVILKSTRSNSQKLSICLQTCISTAVNSFLVFIFFLFRKRAVHSFHLADRCSPFSLGLCVKFIIKEDLSNWICLERAGLCWRLGSSIEVSWGQITAAESIECWIERTIWLTVSLPCYTEVFEHPPLAKRSWKHFFLEEEEIDQKELISQVLVTIYYLTLSNTLRLFVLRPGSWLYICRLFKICLVK